MTEFLNSILQYGEATTRATVLEVSLTIGISFVLGLLISYTYIKTYRGRYYSQSFLHTLIIVGVVISVIIVVIGSNIARAFSLAGALSIIRFRSAIRDPRDVAFIFFAMGTGLACGAGLFLPAIAFTIILCGLIYLLFKLDYGSRRAMQKLLKITIPENLNYEGLFDDILKENLEYFSLLSVRTTNLGTMFELVYSIRGKEKGSEKVLMDEIRARNGNLNVTILLDEQSMDY